MTEKRDELYNAAMEAALHGRYVVAAALEAQRASDGATESPYPVRVFDPEASGDRDEQ